MAYTVSKGTVSHNGKEYRKGTEISGLKKEDAERLIELGVVVEEKRKLAAKDSTNDTE
ncbi:hypothetical protein [Bacillus sp. FJAT-26390]|uniref:DUF7210 family protein n=1 Tax=Bacillus sp. FJAT-26390 TaxID=1743142 RepID=UPI00159EE1E9|nr:hypothetical protein [Bacillus sp. FJAT-26390]